MWYPRLRTARYLGVPPWELDEHLEWERRALVAEAAELGARNVKVEKVS